MASGTGNLPNDGMSFTPFDPLPASQLNDIVENVEALADGSGIGDGAVTPEKRSGGFKLIRLDMSAIGTGEHEVTQVGFRPKMMRFLCGRGDTAFGETTGSLGIGVAIDEDGDGSIEAQYNVGISSRNGTGNNHTGRWYEEVAIYNSITTGGAENNQYAAEVTATTEDGFTLDVTFPASSTQYVICELYG